MWCVKPIGGIVTGDDVLKIGTVDSADYPVKPRPDDIIRKRKPKPPPWWTRPGLIEKEEEPIILDQNMGSDSSSEDDWRKELLQELEPQKANFDPNDARLVRE